MTKAKTFMNNSKFKNLSSFNSAKNKIKGKTKKKGMKKKAKHTVNQSRASTSKTS